MTNWLLLWEDNDGKRMWEAISKEQIDGFLEKLLVEHNVNPATVIIAYNPMLFHWVWSCYHKGLSDVFFGNINKEIYGTEYKPKTIHTPVSVKTKQKDKPKKFGWIAPDGRFFNCDYGEHSATAEKIVGSLQEVYDAETYLEENGWAKILNGMNDYEYSVGMGVDKKMTNSQLNTLTNLGLDDVWNIELWL